MRNVSVEVIKKNIKEMCIEANHFLADDMKEALSNALKKEVDINALRNIKNAMQNAKNLNFFIYSVSLCKQ